MEVRKLKQTVYLIFNNDEYKDYAKQNDVVTPNGLTDDQFCNLSKKFGTNYETIEFEMFWNTGRIPAFCYLRFIETEEE